MQKEIPLPERRIAMLLLSLTSEQLLDLKFFAEGSSYRKQEYTLALLSEFLKWATLAKKQKANTAPNQLSAENEERALFYKIPSPTVLYQRVFKTTDFERKQERLFEQFRSVHTLLEQFIAWQQLQEDEVKIQEYVCTHLARTEYEELFEHQCSRWEKSLSEAKEGHHTFHQKMMLHLICGSHWAFDRQEMPADGFLRAQQQYIYFLQQGTVTATQSNSGIKPPEVKEKVGVGQKKASPRSAETTTSHLPPLPQIMPEPVASRENSPVLPILPEVYHLLLEWKQQPEMLNGSWAAFWEKYGNQFNKFDQIQSETLFKILFNIHIAEINRGNEQALHYLSETYQRAKEQTFYKNWIWSPADYLNGVVALGLGGHYDAMETFIATHRLRLPANIRQSTETLAYAYAAYYKQELQQAHQILQQIRQRRLMLGTRLHTLQLRINYEFFARGQDVDMAQAVNTYKAYFNDKQHQIQPKRLDAYKKLASFVRKLVIIYERRQLREPFTTQIEDIIRELEDASKSKPIAFQWVQQQIEKLKTGARH